MADSKITALTENTSPLVTDILPMVDDPGGTPLTQKVTFASLLSVIYPVGSIYISTASTNPATLFGMGTWSAFGAGKMLVSLDSGDTDFDTAEETGGAKTKTIAQANLPNISTGAGTAHTHVQDAHLHLIPDVRDATTGGSTTNIAKTADATSTTGTLINTANATATNQNESTHTHSLGGSGTALNVMNPYIVTYIFKRTA